MNTAEGRELFWISAFLGTRAFLKKYVQGAIRFGAEHIYGDIKEIMKGREYKTFNR